MQSGMSRWVRWTVWSGLLACSASGCGSTSDGEAPGWQVERSEDPMAQPDHGEVEEPDEIVDPVEPVEPVEPGTPTWCAPQPVAYDRDEVPQLPEGVTYESFCAAPALELEGAEPTRRWRMDAQERRLTASVERPGEVSFQTFRFAPAGHLEYIEIQGRTGFYGTGTGRSTYELDARGEVLHKVATEMGGLEPSTTVKTQTWDGERLLSRIERDGQTEEVVREWTWAWEGGRLVEAGLEDAETGRTHMARWSYDAQTGAPTQVERTLDGVLVRRHTWAYGAEGQLVEHTSWSTSPDHLAEEHGGEPGDWRLVQGLDTLEQTRPFYQGDPWASGAPAEGSDGCAELPRGRYGYPADDLAYQLGVAPDARPTGIGFAHGSDTYGWNYGDQAWYGHDGIGTGWSTLEADYEQLEVRVRWERGQMTLEDITRTVAGRVERLERTRRFDEADQLVRDELVFTGGEERLERALVFERDARGHLIGRELREGAQTLARQRWERDERGRALAYVVEARESWSHTTPKSPLVAGFARGLVEGTSWSWTYEGDLLVARAGGVNEQHDQTLEYDDQGRLVRREGYFGSGNGGEWWWRYDGQGRLVEECADHGGTDHCTTTTYDELGRVAWRERQSGQDDPVILEYNAYVCH